MGGFCSGVCSVVWVLLVFFVECCVFVEVGSGVVGWGL